MEAAQGRVVSQASQATEHRERLLAANDGVRSAGVLVDEYPNPHIEIARLTALLGDEAYLTHFNIRGRLIKVRGRATDGAAVMQSLSEQPEFASVTASGPITVVGNTGLEQFQLDIELAAEDQAEASL